VTETREANWPNRVDAVYKRCTPPSPTPHAARRVAELAGQSSLSRAPQNHHRPICLNPQMTDGKAPFCPCISLPPLVPLPLPSQPPTHSFALQHYRHHSRQLQCPSTTFQTTAIAINSHFVPLLEN